MVWDSVVQHRVVLICGVWLSSCVRGVGEGCGGIVVGDRRVLPGGSYVACFCGKADL